LKVEYFVRTPAVRSFAELAVEFVSRVLKRDVADALSYLVVVEKPQTVDELRQLIGRMCSIVGADETTCRLVEKASVNWAESEDSETST
jgi:hypothetical protein